MAKIAKLNTKIVKPQAGEAGDELSFAYHSETKNTFKFQELDEKGKAIEEVKDAKIGMLYLKKSVFDGDAPEKISVSIRW